MPHFRTISHVGAALLMAFAIFAPQAVAQYVDYPKTKEASSSSLMRSAQSVFPGRPLLVQ
jgi:hypothetical protein